MSDLLKSSDLFHLGWTRPLINRLLVKPDEVEQVKKGSYRIERYLYDPARVEAVMRLPEFVAAVSEREHRKKAPERRRKNFTRTYQSNWHLALPVAAEHLRQLNRFAKWRTCSQANKTAIYDLKNQFIRLLYEAGFCSACWIHRLTLPEKRCRVCYGEGDFCDRCDGTGVYQTAKVLKFYCFQFEIGAKRYTWHQPVVVQFESPCRLAVDLPIKAKVRWMDQDRYIEGFLAGQAVAYCERVNTGAGMAAQLVCPDNYVETLTKLVAAEHCQVLTEPHSCGRTSLWIYRDELAKRLILALQSASAPSELGLWSMGKLFGYGSQDIFSFVECSRLAFPEESSPLPSSGRPHQHFIRGAPEPYYADVDAEIYSAHERVFKKARKSQRVRSTVHDAL